MLVGQTIGSGAYRFEIVQELGSGAMGTVYRAKFHKDEKVVPVALKVVALGLLGNEGAMARFEREANILKQLRHPHIVKLYATGTYRKTPFIAMEFIDGEALDRVLTRRGRLGWEEIVAYAKQLCAALQYAHEKGIIHRDLKPSNLMITREGVLKLTDFGIAKDTDVTALTGHNSTIGTAAYMSPEQCKGDKNLTNKSDLYSLGIVLYELLTGKKPFYADTTVDMFLKHVNEPAPRIGKQVNELPAKLEALILQLMEKDKEDRPIDAAWVARLLGEIEEDAYARKSAGVNAVNRRTEKPRNLDGSKLDEEDREAARALRGKKKKVKKKAEVPFFERKWVKMAGIVLVLLAIAAGAYLGLRPPSADKLAAAIDNSDTTEGRIEAAAKYLERYGESPGELTDKAAKVFREATTRQRQEQLTKRFHSKMQKPDDSDDREAFDAAWQAMEFERAGQLGNAELFWNKVKGRFPEEAKLPYALDEKTLAKAKWGWVAEERLRDIARAREAAAEARKTIENNRRFEKPFGTDQTDPKTLAVRALRLEEFGDREKAVRTWAALIALTEKDFDRHEWYLLACQQHGTAKPPDNSTQARIGLIEQHLMAADKLAAEVRANPEDGPRRIALRNACREITDLYDDETDPAIKAQVARAREIAAAAPK
jgi:serine/threonine-protein kinase